MTATTANPTDHRSGEALQDRLEIIEMSSDPLVHIDARKWAAAGQLFIDRIDVDYTSLNGGEPQTMSSADLIGA